MTLDDLRQVLAQVLKQAPEMADSSAGAIYLDLLKDMEKKLDAGAPAAPAFPAEAIDLLATDRDHDGYARALWHLTEAYLLLPDLSDDVREAAARVREVLVPGPDVWTAAYPTEAQRAEDKKPKLATLATDLAKLPVVGGDASVWAARHINAGIKLGKEMAQQAAVEAHSQSEKTIDGAVMRAQLMKTLGEFRSTLTTEAGRKPALAPVATTAFALFDKLSAERSAAARASAKRKAKEPVAPTTGDA